MGNVQIAVGAALLSLLLLALLAWLLARRRARLAERRCGELQAYADSLKPYAAVADADKERIRLEEEGRRLLAQAQGQAQQVIHAAETDATRVRAQVSELAEQGAQAQRELLADARAKAASMLEQAQEDAKKIAGAAWEAKQKAELYKETVAAMRNVIEGYGDEYLIPNHSVLDDLAEDFSHKEAGEQLKNARVVTRSMVKARTAADCDYKETRRRDTAVRFVVDAFNGKVDSILSTVRHNNFGKLKREIEDAFALVNGTGEAFRNARVTPAYLAARLDELRWAVAATELQRLEKEEQRRIREAMREEERARREYEAAVKKAQKEERAIEKAIAEARRQLETAHEEKRLDLESQLAELQAKWNEAEARNQRAMSMAQQTKRGHVYVISNVGSFGEDVYKIGLTRRLEPLDRIKELGDASVPFEFDVHALIYSEDAPALERVLHEEFRVAQMNKVNPRKEFFRIGLRDIRARVEGAGLQAHWTMTAEAREYRESIAQERTETATRNRSTPEPATAGSSTSPVTVAAPTLAPAEG